MSRTRTESANPVATDNMDETGNLLTSDITPETPEADESVTETETDKFDVSSLTGMNDDEVRETYSNGSRAAKGAIRAHYAKVMKDALAAKDAVAAFAANDLMATLVTIPTKSDKVVDYVEIVANRIICIENGLNALIADGPDNLPEGVELDMSAVSDKLRELRNSYDSELTVNADVSAFVDKTLKSVKFGLTGPSRSIVAHVAEWAASVASGTFATCATIGSFRSATYGTDRPSDGAIAAHLFPSDSKTGDAKAYGKSDLTGVIPVEALPGKNARGARKI